MAQIYLICVPEDEVHATPLAAFLQQRGHQVRLETGKFGFPPARRDEVTLALWSRAAMMSVKRLIMTNRAIDAWETGHLIMAKLDQGIVPSGLGDIDMIDLTFEAARTHRYLDVDQAIRDADEANLRTIREKAVLEHGLERSEVSLGDSFQNYVDKRLSQLETDSNQEIFISYAHADADTVLPLVDSVEEAGKSVWIDRDGMRAGQGWAGMIVRAIKAARMVCLMCSKQSFASDHVRREVYLADKYKKGILPVRLDAAEMDEDIEYFLAGVQWVDLAGVPGAEQGAKVAAALAA